MAWEELKQMSNSELLDNVDYFFGYDGYYAEEREEITKELERRFNVGRHKDGTRFDRKRSLNGKGNS